MSTRSNIGIQNDDGTITAIYCHFDGYPEGVGDTLRTAYTDGEKVKALIALGNISSLAENVAPPPGVNHSFDNRANSVTTAYMRDRGETGQEARTFANESDYHAQARESWAEYAYLWRDGKWLCWELYGKPKLIDLYAPAEADEEDA
jgi:hypothetical protein